MPDERPEGPKCQARDTFFQGGEHIRMQTSADQTVYRIREYYAKEKKPKKYRRSFELTDEDTRRVMATGDLVGRTVFIAQTICDQNRQPRQMKPNRKIMPARWTVTDPRQRVVMQFDQKIMGKLVNPIYKVLLALLDGEGREVYRLVDPRTNIPDRIMSANTGQWTLVEGDKPVATLGVGCHAKRNRPRDFSKS